MRQVQSAEGVLVIDDSVEAKSYSDESELICWHWDHVSGRSVKGVNLLTALYYTQDVSLPVAFELVRKPDMVTDKKTGRPKRQARVSKNALYQQMVRACVDNALPFGYVLNDTWFASADNMVFVKNECKREFVMPLKDNRHVTFDAPQHPNRAYTDVSALQLEVNTTYTIWLEGVDFALLLAKQVFTNEDGSQGVVYLVTSEHDACVAANHDALPKTVEGRRVPQVAQEQPGVCAFAYQNDPHPDQPYLCQSAGLRQDGTIAPAHQAQSFRHESATLQNRHCRGIPAATTT